MKFKLLIACIVLFFSPSISQEIDCEITLNHEAVTSGESKENLVDFVQQLKQYINTNRWTKEDFGADKIKCTMEISIQGTNGPNQYVAKIFIGSQRPIYKSDRSTGVVRLMDDKWEFEYIRNQAMTLIESRFDPLLSFIDFYMYLIIGYDADTYKAKGGTPYFQRANDIINLARGSANAGKGWDPAPQGTYSRLQLVDELLSTKFDDYRRAVHNYFYKGLDYLYKDSEKALKRMLTSLESIRKLSVKINQPSLVIRTFFDIKYLEIAESFKAYSDPGVYTRLSEIDPYHQKTYDEYRLK